MRNPRSLLPAFVLAAGLLGSSSANANHRDFCSSVPSACVFTGPDAPVLAVSVCWSSSTATATLMTGATCPTGGWPYVVKYGLVDPLTSNVTGFVPLDDTCSNPDLCQPGYLAPESTWEAVICCFNGTCWPADDLECAGQLSFCTDGASNEDGTVTCFDED